MGSESKLLEYIINHENFKKLLTDIKENFFAEEQGMTNSRRNTVLYALNWLGHKDEDILRLTCENLIKENPITTTKVITADDLSHSFYNLSKFKYTN